MKTLKNRPLFIKIIHDSIMHIGLKIKMIRLSKGLKQIDLADKINKTRALVSHIEQTGQVNHYTLEAIANVLEVDMEVFKTDIVSESGKMYYEKDNEINQEANKDLTIIKLEEEITFLKKLIKSQIEVIESLSNKKNEN